MLGHPALLWIFILRSVSLSLCLFVSLSLCISVSLSLCLSVSLSLCLSVSLSLCLSVSLSLCLFVSLPICLYASLYLCLFVSLSLLWLQVWRHTLPHRFNFTKSGCGCPIMVAHPLLFYIYLFLLLREVLKFIQRLTQPLGSNVSNRCSLMEALAWTTRFSCVVQVSLSQSFC